MITAIAFLFVAMIGAVLRAVIGHKFNQHRGMAWGTMLVNITGSAALGALSTTPPPLLTVLGTAGLGAYTTFSSFSRDALALVEERKTIWAIFYVATTCVLCISAAWVAIALVH